MLYDLRAEKYKKSFLMYKFTGVRGVEMEARKLGVMNYPSFYLSKVSSEHIVL